MAVLGVGALSYERGAHVEGRGKGSGGVGGYARKDRAEEVSPGCGVVLHLLSHLLLTQVLVKSFCKSQLPHKSVNLSCVSVLSH